MYNIVHPTWHFYRLFINYFFKGGKKVESPGKSRTMKKIFLHKRMAIDSRKRIKASYVIL